MIDQKETSSLGHHLAAYFGLQTGGQCILRMHARSMSPSENRIKLPPIEHSPLNTPEPLPRLIPLPRMASTPEAEGAGVGSNEQQSETIALEPDALQPVHSTTDPLIQSATNPLCDDPTSSSHPPATAPKEQQINISAGQQLQPKPESWAKQKVNAHTQHRIVHTQQR